MNTAAIVEDLDTYTACLVQPVIKFAYKRDDISENLERYLGLIDTVARRFGSPSAPLKLMAFPEFFLQGFTTRPDIDMDYYKREILITLPGPESDRLAAKARQHGIYILGCALELDERLPEYFFNTAFIINPEGEIVHKYRKAIPAIHAEMAMSPHDLLSRYMALYGQKKDVLATVFPVTDTPIGRIGTFICMDGHFPEVTRAMALQGAEVLVRPTAFPEPLVSSPMNTWELQNRVRAHENMAYVLAPNTGGLITSELPTCFTPGDTMAVDYNGLIIGRAPYPGESIVCVEINLRGLRARRQDPRRNFLTQIRSELFQDMYKDPIYPQDLFLADALQDRKGVSGRSPKQVIDAFNKLGIFREPS